MTTQNDHSIGYFLIGIGVGLLGGLLLAPRSGEEIREDVRRRASEGLNYLNRQAERLRERTENAVSKTKDWMGRHRDAGDAGQSTSSENQSPYGQDKPTT